MIYLPKRFYTGVGSRIVPLDVRLEMRRYAMQLRDMWFTVRTGDADGCDKVFRRSVRGSERKVYAPESILNDDRHWSYEEVLKYIPKDRKNFYRWKPYVRALIARDMMQVLGDCGTQPSEFLLCYAPSLDYADSSSGGTGYAIRCALAHNVPVYNLFSEEDTTLFDQYINSL